MRVQLLAALTFGLLLAPARAEDKPAKGDKEKLQGTWAVVSGERNGKPIPEEMVKNVKLAFAGDKFTIHNKDRKTEGTFKLIPDKKPKQIDVDMGGQLAKGIYELDGDTLKIAHGEAGAPRPKEFSTKEGSRVAVVVLKRQKS
jgi:uncharacterized protein (TIGR03067 family)